MGAPVSLIGAVWVGVAVFFSSLLPITAHAASAGADTSMKAFVVVDDKTGHILAESKSNDKLQVASLTKIATAIVVLDWARIEGHGLEQVMTVPPAALATGGSSPVGFEAGDQITVRDLLYAALLKSDNIAAEALAYNVGNDLPADPSEGGGNKAGITPTVRFVIQMNALAKHLGMERTRFYNPSGLDGKERPFSTAADMARLTRNALSKADFRFFVAQKERHISINRAGAPTDVALQNSNDLLGLHNVDGVKTGQTARAGNCLIISAARESIVKQQETGKSEITPRRLIVVVLGDPNDRFGDAARLLERGEGLYDQWAAAGYPSVNPKENL
jgi:D-alanyl-D-alanine carboxypeptidase (penicillin-binding protein 5/6)